MVHQSASADDDEVTPVPMPNTEVKLISAENTWMETSWEDKKVLAFFMGIRKYSLFCYPEFVVIVGCFLSSDWV